MSLKRGRLLLLLATSLIAFKASAEVPGTEHTFRLEDGEQRPRATQGRGMAGGLLDWQRVWRAIRGSLESALGWLDGRPVQAVRRR